MKPPRNEPTRADPGAAALIHDQRPLLGLPTILLSCIGLFLAVVWFYAGKQASTVALITLSDGGSALAWVLSMTLLGYWLLRCARIDSYGALMFATAAGLGLGLMSLVLCGLALVGWLNHSVVAGLELFSAVIGIVTLSRTVKGSVAGWLDGYLHRHLETASTSQWMWTLAMPALAIAVVGACIVPGLLWRPEDPHPYDVLIYHLQVPREWYELGRMVPLQHNVYSYFPFNTEMHFLAGMYLHSGPWDGMYAAQFMSLSFAILAVLAVYASARENSSESGNSSPVLSAILMAVLPWTVMVSCVAYVESLLLLYSALTIAWTLRAFRGGGAIRAMTMAGLMAGFASGVKLTSVPMLLLAAPLAVAVVCLGRRCFVRQEAPSSEWSPPRTMVIGCIAFVVAGFAVLSPWLIRNLIWTGNPIFPVGMGTLGHANFSADQIERFRIAHSAKESFSSAAAYAAQLFHEVLGEWRYGYLLWPLAILAGLQQWRRPQVRVCLVLLLLMLVCWIGITHLISRFFVIAIPIAAALVGEIRWGRARWMGIGAVTLVVVLSWFNLHQPINDFAAFGREGAFGIKDFSPMVPDGAARVEQDGDGQVIMVGDSQAFLHQIPMRRLHYRTVFDLNMTGLDPTKGRDVISSWAGVPIDSLPAGTVIFIDPIELARLSNSYYKVPPLPADIPGPRDRPFVIDPRTLP